MEGVVADVAPVSQPEQRGTGGAQRTAVGVDEIAYGTTQKGEAFREAGKTVSRRSVADLVVSLAMNPGMEIGRSVGIHHETGQHRRST